MDIPRRRSDAAAGSVETGARLRYRSIKMYRSPEGFLTPPDWPETERAARARSLANGTRSAAVEKALAAFRAARFGDAPAYDCDANNYFCMEWPLYVRARARTNGSGRSDGDPSRPRRRRDRLDGPVGAASRAATRRPGRAASRPGAPGEPRREASTQRAPLRSGRSSSSSPTARARASGRGRSRASTCGI